MKNKNPVKKNNSNKVVIVVIAILTLFLYGKTISYDYTLDDESVFLKNKSISNGIKSIPKLFSENSIKSYYGGNQADNLYRPVTLSTFAIEKSISGYNSKVSHFISILIYALCGFVFFSFLKKLFVQWPVWLSGAITILFIAHPIHTEVVCNVKGRDDLLGCLFGLLSLLALLKESDESTIKRKLIGPLWFLLALYSKESSLTFLAIVPFVLFYKGQSDWKNILIKTLTYAIAACLFLLSRHFALSGETGVSNQLLLNNSLNGASTFSQLIGTKFYILLFTIKQVLFPYPLSWDYSYNQIPVVELLNPLSILSILIHVSLLIVMFRLINTKDLVSFGILFFLVTSAVTNNFFIKIASNFADRFLFVPVIGYLLFLAGIILRLLKIQPGDAVKNKTARFIFFGLCLLFCFLSYARIPVWQNNFELYKSGVITAPNSARTYSSLGYAYINKAQYASNLNDQSLFLSEAKENFKQSLNIVATNFDSYFNLGNIALMEGDTNAAKNFYQQCLKLSPEYRMANHNLALIYSNRNQNDSALYYLDKIPMNIAEYQMEYPVYSYIYLQKKNFQKARYYTEKGISEAPNDPVNYKNMSEVFLALDDTANAIAYYQKYRELGGR